MIGQLIVKKYPTSPPSRLGGDIGLRDLEDVVDTIHADSALVPAAGTWYTGHGSRGAFGQCLSR
jgi:hypothetical protein